MWNIWTRLSIFFETSTLLKPGSHKGMWHLKSSRITLSLAEECESNGKIPLWLSIAGGDDGAIVNRDSDNFWENRQCIFLIGEFEGLFLKIPFSNVPINYICEWTTGKAVRQVFWRLLYVVPDSWSEVHFSRSDDEPLLLGCNHHVNSDSHHPQPTTAGCRGTILFLTSSSSIMHSGVLLFFRFLLPVTSRKSSYFPRFEQHCQTWMFSLGNMWSLRSTTIRGQAHILTHAFTFMDYVISVGYFWLLALVINTMFTIEN